MSIHYRLKIATNIFSARTLNPNPRGQGNLKTSVTKAAFYRLLAAQMEELRKNIYSVRSASLRASLRQRGSMSLRALTARLKVVP